MSKSKLHTPSAERMKVDVVRCATRFMVRDAISCSTTPELLSYLNKLRCTHNTETETSSIVKGINTIILSLFVFLLWKCTDLTDSRRCSKGNLQVWKISRQQLMHTETIIRLPSDKLIVWWSVGTRQVAPSWLLTYCMLRHTLILQWMRLVDLTMWWGNSVRQSRQLTSNISSHTTCSLRSAATAHSRYSELTLTLDLTVNVCRDHWHAEILPKSIHVSSLVLIAQVVFLLDRWHTHANSQMPLIALRMATASIGNE